MAVVSLRRAWFPGQFFYLAHTFFTTPTRVDHEEKLCPRKGDLDSKATKTLTVQRSLNCSEYLCRFISDGPSVIRENKT